MTRVFPWKKGRLGLRLAAWAALAFVLLFAAAWFAFPFPRAALARYPAGMTLLDREGIPLRMRLGPDDTDCRLRYRPDTERDWICKAVVAAEDQRFWSHHGVDPAALARAAGQNLRGLRRVSGASTITTQVVRLLQPRRRTLAAKLSEAFRAMQLERILGKREILEQYLNRAPFGANLIGIEAASRRYFAKAPADLSLAEAALLAGMPQSPSRLRPDRFPERAQKRQAYVLERMLVCGMITEAQRAAAAAQPVVTRRDAYPFRAPHFCDLLLEEWDAGGLEQVQRFNGSTVQQGSQHATRNAQPATEEVRSSLDPALQRLAEETLRRHAAALRGQGVFGGAVVVVEVRSGAVRALAGSPDYRDAAHAGQVNGATASRSAGSTLKPFAYALAMDQGRITPGTVLADVPRTFRDYVPVNFDGAFNGLVPARTALVLSLNIPALDLVEREGVPEFLGLLRRLGFGTLRESPDRYGLGLALGNGSVRLLDLTNAYACLARGGEWRPYRLLETEERKNGRTEEVEKSAGERKNGKVEEIEKSAGERKNGRAEKTSGAETKETGGVLARRIFSPEAAWLTAEMLSGDERAADTTGHHADVRLPKIAWKTGTSSGFRDAWAVSFNPEYAIGVWLGNPDGRASPALVGARAAVPVMWDVVRGLYPSNDSPWFAAPAGVAKRAACTVSGLPPGPHCPTTAEEWCIMGVSSAAPCGVHRLCAMGEPTLSDGKTEKRKNGTGWDNKDAGPAKNIGADGVGGAEGVGGAGMEVREVWPSAVEVFMRKRGASGSADSAAEAGDGPPRLVSPQPGAAYRLLDGGAATQRLPLRAEYRGGGVLYWFVDDQLVAAVPAAETASWPLARGRHVIVCCGAAGRSARAEIDVD